MLQTKAEGKKCYATSEKLALPDVAWAGGMAKLRALIADL